MITPLHSRRLIFVTGKGGVGKSTVSAALGHALAAQGRRVLVVETDTYSAMADLFGVGAHQDTETPLNIGPNLEFVNVRAETALVHVIRQFVPSERVSRAVIGNRVAQVFFQAAPSVNEFSILNRVRHFVELEESGRRVYDHVIVDLPASGHAVTFLSVPGTLYGMIRVGGLAKLAARMNDMLRDPAQVAIVAVALPEEMPVNETIELSQAFRDTLGRDVTLAALNMVHHAPFAAEHREVFEQLQQNLGASPDDSVERLVRGNALAMSWHERDAVYVDILQERMACPVVEIPMFYEPDGLKVVEKTSAFLGSEPGADELAS